MAATVRGVQGTGAGLWGLVAQFPAPLRGWCTSPVRVRHHGGRARSSPRPLRGGAQARYGCGPVGAERTVPRAPCGVVHKPGTGAAPWGPSAQFPAPLAGWCTSPVRVRARRGRAHSSPRPLGGGAQARYGCGTVGAERAVPRAPCGVVHKPGMGAGPPGPSAQFPAPLRGVHRPGTGAGPPGPSAQFPAPLGRVALAVSAHPQGRGELRDQAPLSRSRPPAVRNLRGAGNRATSHGAPAPADMPVSRAAGNLTRRR